MKAQTTLARIERTISGIAQVVAYFALLLVADRVIYGLSVLADGPRW